MTEHHVSPDFCDRLVDRLWPLTLTIGILMTVVVFVFLAFSFCAVFGAALSILINSETWPWLQEQ